MKVLKTLSTFAKFASVLWFWSHVYQAELSSREFKTISEPLSELLESSKMRSWVSGYVSSGKHFAQAGMLMW